MQKSTYALLIYRTAPELPPGPSSADALREHRRVQATVAEKGQLHAVAQLADIKTARTVRRAEGGHDVCDGPYIETKEWLVGFYLLDCDSEEEALSHARSICPDEAHAVEVRPVAWRWKG